MRNNSYSRYPTDPYTYKNLINDPELVSEKKEQLAEELREYEEYSGQLESILQDILKDLIRKGIHITWEMN